MTTSATPTIADQVAEMQAKTAASGRLPAHVRAAFGAALQQLAADGIPPSVTAVGSPMPDGQLLEPSGAATTLARARGGAPAVVVLYRGAWCPYCNLTLRAYQQDLVPALQQRGVRLIAVSPQKPDGSLTDIETRKLTFTVLSDRGNGIARQLGVAMTPSAESVAAQGELGLDLAASNADGSTTLPMPTVLVVDRAGVIRFLDVHPVYTERTEIADILTVLDTLRV